MRRRDPTGRVRLGDVLVAINDKTVTSVNHLFLTLEKYKVGGTVNTALLRDGKREQVKLP